jgi:hypothetical protein
VTTTASGQAGVIPFERLTVEPLNEREIPTNGTIETTGTIGTLDLI